jgi:UDP-glucose 4-epimerase
MTSSERGENNMRVLVSRAETYWGGWQMRVLVTGANGFIGQYVVKALKEAKHKVITLDNAQRPGTHLDITADITKPLPRIEGLDAVIHLAAIANPRECDHDPSGAFDVNANGTHQVLSMALASGARKVVYASTAHVYGISPRYLPTDEVHRLWLQNNYTLTKIVGEQLCELYYENHGLGYTSLRLYNAYGPGQAAGYFIPDMISKAKEGSIVLPGGNTTKDFVWVEEVAQAFVLAASSPFAGAVNIGTGVETELSAIAGYIAKVGGASFSTTPVEGATRMQADISRARQVLGWEPKVTMLDGLDRILKAKVAA